MVQHITTLAALRAIAEGRRAPRQKYAALQRAALIRVIGHGPRSKPVITDAGRAALSNGRAS
ncbi:hypothetical protein [Methylobacterium sp. Leaf91]|uniref:hypothetical protein n=1 Tax=Methylobacterium sp. Leaf91 TaxID=1736247 RepID=UPI0006F24476|nr:hypothetical protein [Methylobacterium sp. Leaf91]KQO94618.1 hypothetical protein ASF32_19065 [Methylobacterium sp. Leaf91]